MDNFKNGDKISQDAFDFVISFAGKRRVISTSALNGGLREDLTAVFNHCDKNRETGFCDMLGDTYEEHLQTVAMQNKLDRARTAGLSTAANLEWVSTCSEEFGGYTVTAIVSGGVVRNGRRAGDPATMWEVNGEYFFEDSETNRTSGTVNILLHIDADVEAGALTKILMVAAEAKAATIVDCGYMSCYSDRKASGSGTDGIIVISDCESAIHLTAAGTDVKLGAMVGRVVSEAVKDQLEKQAEYERTHQLL